MPEDRRHAAIMFTDIVGYTALMGRDEDAAFNMLSRNHTLHEALIEKHNGILIKEIGDGTLASFPLASNAVRCAIEIQKECKKQNIQMKIGIHEGEMVFAGGDVLGDGVNIASRLQEEAQKGCINISASVYRDIKNKADIQTQLIGERSFKNVDEPIKIYRVLCGEEEFEEQLRGKELVKKPQSKLPYYLLTGIVVVILVILLIWKVIPSKENLELEKSIAVLPIKSLSDDPEKQYLADGVMDAITSHLAKISELRVIARTSLEQYRDYTKDVREIGQEINVNFLLEGSFQMFGNDARLIVQLINTNDGSHIWSNEYDREWKDIFKVQSEVAQAIANEIKVIITPEEKQDIETIQTSDITAYDYYLRGEEYIKRSFEEQDYRYAIKLYEQAIEIDPEFTLAWVGLAAASRFIFAFFYDRSEENLIKTKQYLDKALTLSPESKEVQLEEAKYHYLCRLDYPKALQILEKLESDYPYDAELLLWIGFVYRRMGEFRIAMEYHDRAILLNPSEWLNWQAIGYTLEVLREYNEAEKYFKKAFDLNPSITSPYWSLLKLHLLTGDVIKAKKFLKNNQEHIDLPNIKLFRSSIEILDGNYEEAIQITESLSEDSISQQGYYFYSKHLRLGLIYYMMSNEKMAVKHFEVVRIFIEEKNKKLYYDSRIYGSLGIAYAGLGNKLQAIEAGRKSIEIRGFHNDAFDGFGPEMDMAKNLLILGEYDEVLLRLENLLDRTGYISVELLKLDPFWNPIRDLDKFKEIISNPKYQINLSEH